ncbi:MAG: phosphotransferase [Paludibacteraceae bacterium]|nr:phosphotransferase [Paludibacteraceae bacterium]
MNELENLFVKYTGEKLLSKEELSASGSHRRYFRLESKNNSLIGVEGTSKEENRAFIELAKHFYQQGLPVPLFLTQSSDGMYYLEEDLGNTLLFDYIAEGRKTGVFCESEKEMLRKTIRELPKIQVKGAVNLDFSVCYPQPEFNERSILWDLNYFKYCFLKATGLDFQENLLEDDFKKLSNILLKNQTNTFMYRDFQSRNVMIKNDEPYFIDFQGGRKGPVYYDVASFLWQAKANYNNELREELLQNYLEVLASLISFNESEFKEQLKHYVLFRTLQVLGAYGFRGYFEKKPHFLQSIPFAIENLRSILQDNITGYPYLIKVLQQLTELKQFREVSVRKPLTVKIYSFAYKKGIPQDDSGNGGGFVFDCRAINNPGKYERFTYFTGLDDAVTQFLEEDGEILILLENAYNLVDASVKRYMDRGFTNLMVSFGCTGGQHRSVYAAQKMAEHIHQKFGVEVHLIHRELNKEELFLATA